MAPALFLGDNLLHPKEFARTRANEAAQLHEIAANYTRWQVAHLLGFLAILAFAAGVLGLAFLVRRRRSTPGVVGGALGIVGLLGLAAAVALDGFTWGVLGDVSRRVGGDGVAQALHEVQTSGWAWQYYAPALMFALALVLLGLTAARTHAVSPWAAGLLTAGALVSGTEGVVVSHAYFVAGAALLLAGSGAVGVQLARMTDEEFGAA